MLLGNKRLPAIFVPMLIAALTMFQAVSSGAAPLAEGILDASGVRGGLVVHLGCGDGQEAAVRRRFDADVQRQLAEQDAALSGKRGGLLWAVSKDDGTRRKQIELDTMPVWDGLTAAEGKLLMATVDGRVICFSGD